MDEILHVGLDVGSTTVKIIVMNSNKETIYSNYERHFSDTKNTICNTLEKLAEKYSNNKFTLALTGSGAMSAAKFLGVDFIQEVVSCKRAVEKYIPKTDVVIELGGEDAKIIYFDESIEQRMNGTCAGGTGAFLDQMASLLHTDTQGLNTLAKNYNTIYPIASRCGVFAKTDIQPLLNEGAAKEDIAASIFQAVVNQTISGLACGRPIKGNIAFLGGPLNYLSELRQRFIETLNLKPEEIIIPEEAHLIVAKGAALDSINSNIITIEELKEKVLKNYEAKEAEFGEKELRELERVVVLKVVDQKWMDHIDNMDELKNGIGLRAYAQKDPVVQYRIEGTEMFEEMNEDIKLDVVKILSNVQRAGDMKRTEAAKITATGLQDTAINLVDGKYSEKEGGMNKTVVNEGPKVGRNDPCPCGSGKKYKNCCGK